jgi:hypothetical protein
MPKKWSYAELEAFGRVRLSENFYMREFLHSEIAQIYGLVNAPNDLELAIEAGSMLCAHVLEPLQQKWGKIHIRSGYRASQVNALGNQKKLNCSDNEKNIAAHIWDERDSKGFLGATACIVIPAYHDYYESTQDWASLAWWIHEYIPDYYELCFFKEQCSFNIRWYESVAGGKTIRTFVRNPDTGDKSAILKKDVVHPFYKPIDVSKRYSRARNLTRSEI